MDIDSPTLTLLSLVLFIYISLYSKFDRCSDIFKDLKEISQEVRSLRRQRADFYSSFFLSHYIETKIHYLEHYIYADYFLFIIGFISISIVILFNKDPFWSFPSLILLLYLIIVNHYFDRDSIPFYKDIIKTNDINEFFECFKDYETKQKLDKLKREYYRCLNESDKYLQKQIKEKIFEELPY